MTDQLRCAFTFADGRRCRMLRHPEHPTLCVAHARQEQDPHAARVLAATRLEAETHIPIALDNRAAVRRAIRRIYHMAADQRIDVQRALAMAELARLLLINAPPPRRRRATRTC